MPTIGSAQTPEQGGFNPSPTRVGPPDRSGGGSSGQSSGGFGSNVPSSVDVRNRDAPEVDQLRSQISDLRGRIDALQERPTQQELDDLRNRAQQAVEVAFRLGARRVLRAINR